MSSTKNSLPMIPNKITEEERVQIARETNRIHLPREVKKWIQSLDLSYKIKDISKDLANGFSIAEILSRYPVHFFVNKDSKVEHNPLEATKVYTVNMKEFSNGSSFKERTTNWNHIAKILRKFYQFPITDDTCERIINKAPNAAFEFLCVLYRQLTKREANILNKIDETDKFRNYAEVDALPKYMRPTASRLVQDSEVQRIKDDLIRKYKLNQIIEEQKNYLAKERQLFMQQEAYEKEEKLRKLQNKSMKMSKNASKNMNMAMPNSGINNMENPMNINSRIPENEKDDEVLSSQEPKEERYNLLGQLLDLTSQNKENESVEKEFQQLIQQNFLEEDREFQLQLKSLGADRDLISFFFDKENDWTPQMIEKLFTGYQYKTKDIAGIISRDLVELIPFIDIVCKFYDHLTKSKIDWTLFKTTSLEICKSIHNNQEKSEKCDNIFINFCLDIVLEKIKTNPIYRNEMCHIIFNLITNNYYSINCLLKRISKMFANSDELLYYHIMANILNNICYYGFNKLCVDLENEQIFFDVIKKGLCSSCDLIKIKSLYMVTKIFQFVPDKCIVFFDSINNLTRSTNWEILGLILIYSSLILKFYNEQKRQREIYNAEQKQIENEIMEEEAVAEEQEIQPGQDEIKEDAKEENNVSDAMGHQTQSNQNMSQNNQSAYENQQMAEMEQGEYTQMQIMENLHKMEEKETSFVQIINDIFRVNSPFMTIKIGFIYLAEIIEYYPNLSSEYMKLLIEYKDDDIREEILAVPMIEGEDIKNMENIIEKIPKEEYTGNAFTEKYRTMGAPKLWNQLEVAKIFRDYIINGKYERFEDSHINILRSIIITQYIDENDKSWITLFNDLKRLIFDSLSEPASTDTALIILQELFSYELILPDLLDSTKDLFNTTMKVIYQKRYYPEVSSGNKGEEDKEKTRTKMHKNNPSVNMKNLLTFISELKNEKKDCKDYVYNLIKSFAIQNDKLYLQSNLLTLLNKIYEEKRGTIFGNKHKVEE